jgi:hypothetical protein
MPRRLLVLVTAPDPDDELRNRVASYAGDNTEVLVVAPATDLSFTQWLASDEDEARRLAEERARRAAAAVPGRLVDARVGESDPLVAAEDALRAFPADELLVVTRPREEAGWLEREAARLAERLDLPLTYLVDDDAGIVEQPAAPTRAQTPTLVEEIAREIVRGESPWIIQNAVLLVVLTVAALGLAIVLIFSHAFG